MTTYFYIRVSTDAQNTQNQRYALETFAKSNNIQADTYIEEIISSRKPLAERKLGQILASIKKGDTLITTEISRLGRNMLEVMGILQICLEKKCEIITIKESYHLKADIQSKVLAFAFSLAGEIERQLISERTKESLKRLKNEGKHLGRPYGFSYRKLHSNHKTIIKLIKKKTPKTQIAKQLGCTWSTLNRYIKEHNLSQNKRKKPPFKQKA